MFHLKLRAFSLLNSNKTAACRCAFLASFFRLCSLLAYTAALACLFPEARELLRTFPVIGRLWGVTDGLLPSFLLSALGAAYSVAACALTYTLYLLIINRDEKRQFRLLDFFRIGNGLRYMRFQAQKTAAILRLFLVFFSPPLLTLLLLFFLLAAGVPSFLLLWGTVVLALQSLLSAGMLYVSCQQFSITLYLLCLHPMLSVPDALRSGALLTEKKQLRLALLRLQTLPLRLIARSVLPLPFPRVLLAAIETAANEIVYGERKLKKNPAAVVYYIGKNSIIKPEENEREKEK